LNLPNSEWKDDLHALHEIKNIHDLHASCASISPTMSAVLQQRTLAGVSFDFQIRPALRLCDVEDIFITTRALGACPKRHTLIAMIESGELEGKLTRVGWIIFEDSLKQWLRQLMEPIAA